MSLTSPSTRNPTVIVPGGGPSTTGQLLRLRLVLQNSLRAALAPGPFEEFHDLLIRGLLEVPVPEAYGPEISRGLQADQLVHGGPKKLRGLGGAYGCGQDQSSRPP